MSNSKDNSKAGLKSTSFNKSKSISKAIDDLEKEEYVSKSISNLENEDMGSSVDNISFSDDLSKNIDSARFDEDLFADNLNKDSFNSDLVENIDEKELYSSEDKVNNVFTGSENLDSDLDKKSYFSDDEVILSKPTKKAEKLKESNLKSKFKINLSIKAKIFTLIGVIVGMGIIVYGINNFSNVSDRVIDHTFLGETGTWSIIIILIGLIIVLLTIFFVVFYQNALNNDNIHNTQIKNIFNGITEIKNIDGDFYKKDYNKKSESIFKSILKVDGDETMDESSENNLKTSNFSDDEISVVHQDNHKSRSLEDNYGVSDVDDLFDSNSDVDSLDVLENDKPSFNGEDNNLDSISEFGTYKSKPSKKPNYNDLSSFLDDEDDDIFVGNSDNIETTESVISPKSNNSEDLAAKKARIIEGTNFDNSLRKNKK